MLDQILGENNFRCEIIWRRNAAKGLASKGFAHNHDTILYYAGPDFTWNPAYQPYDMDDLDGKTASQYTYHDPDGRLYQLTSLINPNPNRPNLTYEFMGMKKVWRWTRERMEAARISGLVVQTKPGNVPRFKRYLDEQEGRAIDDVWTDIPPLQARAQERLGYPTQKPLPLLERIIEACSKPNDIVLDAFCGCGTALHAAEILKRQWIGIDVSPTACRVMAKRLRDECGLQEDEALWKAGRGFVVRDLPWTPEKLRKIPPFEFENWAVIALGGIANKAKVGDMGVDGRIFPVSATPTKESKEVGAFASPLNFMDDWYPIQVKQKDKTGRPDIDSFEAVLIREERKKGFFVSFDYTGDAMVEIDRFFRQTGKVIIPFTVSEILNEQIAHKLA